jgi:hypothetical protein
MDGRIITYKNLIRTSLNALETSVCKVLKNDNFGGRELSYNGRRHITHLDMPLEV